jgi:transcriptional regulator with XRE-family HTH domain
MAGIGRRKKTACENDFNVRVGARLSEARKAKRLTAGKFGDLIGVEAARLYSYETGRVGVPLYLIPDVCRVLGLPLSDLF